MTKARNIADIGSNDVLDTDANGVDVTGSVTSDGITVDGVSNLNGTVGVNNTSGYASVEVGGSTGAYVDMKAPNSDDFDLRIIHDATSATPYNVISAKTGDLFIATGSSATNRVNISNTTGDITVYKDDGSTAGMTFDASAGSIAVGTSNLPSDVSVVAADGIKFDVGTSDTTRIYAKSTGTGSYSLGSSGGSAIAFHRLADNSDEIGFETHHAGNNHTERMRLNYHGQLTLEGTGTPFDTTPSKNGLQLYYESDSGVATIASYSNGGGTQLDFQTNTGAGATDRIMTINTAGVVVNPDAEDKDFRVASDNNSNMLLVDGGNNYVSLGTNATDIGSSSSGEGVTYRNGESLRVQRASGDPLIVNRVTDDGSIIAVRKNGAGIGYIGSDSGKMTVNSSGSNLVFQTGGTSRINIDSTQMYPETHGAMNLGHPSVKWGDLLLDGDALIDQRVRINSSTTKGRLNIAGTVDDGVQVFMQHNECMVIGAMSGNANDPAKNATITFESQHLRAMTIEMESSGHKYNNGNDKWHTRHVYSVMSEGSAARFNQRLSNLEFALSTNRMTTTVTKISGTNLWTAQITFASGYQGAFHFRMMGYGVQGAPTSLVYS